MNRLIVAFDSDHVNSRVKEMLASSSLTPRSIHRTGAEVVRAVRFMGGGSVVCGVKLLDMTADQLYADIGGMAHMLVIGKQLHLEMYATCGFFKLPLPINHGTLGASVRMLLQLEEMEHKKRNSRTASESLAIAHAKEILCKAHGMTEAEAHRYLQKRSMDVGIRIAETAGIIIDEYHNK